MYLKITNGVPAKYTLGQLRRDNPQTSFPKQIPNDMLESYDVYPFTTSTRPEIDSLTQRIVEGSFEQNDAGKWILSYEVENRPLEEAKKSVRDHRNRLLADTDWRFRSDMSPSQEWIDYCQALRDIPSQEGFPYSVTWPTKPE